MEPHIEPAEVPVEPIAPPKKTPKIGVPAAIITGAAILGLAMFLTFGQKGAAPAVKEPAASDPTSVAADVATIRPTDYVRGSANAQIALIEYSDSDCPYCQRFHDVLKSVQPAYGEKVAWVYRLFPLNIHPNAYTEAIAATCVGQLGGSKAFWDYIDIIMNVTLTPEPKSNEALFTFATQVGVDTNLMKTCMKDEKVSQAIDASIDEAKKIGARGTPFSIAVNLKTGKQVVIPGAQSLEGVKATIDALMK